VVAGAHGLTSGLRKAITGSPSWSARADPVLTVPSTSERDRNVRARSILPSGRKNRRSDWESNIRRPTSTVPQEAFGGAIYIFPDDKDASGGLRIILQ
jgi:hypothetical protein